MSKADKERQARRQRMLARERGHTSTYPIPGTSGDIGLRTPQLSGAPPPGGGPAAAVPPRPQRRKNNPTT